MDKEFDKALEQASDEYKGIFKKLRFIKKIGDRVSAANMSFMRARDIEREIERVEREKDRGNGNGYPKFAFTVTMYDPEGQTWNRCPGCGDPEINKVTNGFDWQGCFRCHVLLDKTGIIKSMDPNRKKPEQKEEKAPEQEPVPDFKTAAEMAEEEVAPRSDTT